MNRFRARTIAAIFLFGVVSSTTAQTRFVVTSDGNEVLDRQTGLTWLRCMVGAAMTQLGCTQTGQIYTHAEALTVAKQTGVWRLPNLKELTSIVDEARIHPSIDQTAFPDPSQVYCWSSTPGRVGGINAWAVDFSDGAFFEYPRTNFACVRLVR